MVGHPLTLATVCSDGSEVQSEHYIVAEKYPDGSWSLPPHCGHSKVSTLQPGMSEEATLAQLRQSLGLLQVAFDAAAEAIVIVEPAVKCVGATSRC